VVLWNIGLGHGFDLRISESTIPKFYKKDFDGLGNTEILHANQIGLEDIEDGSFTKLSKFLNKIDLAYNKLTIIRYGKK